MEKADLYNISDGDLGSTVAAGIKKNFEGLVDDIKGCQPKGDYLTSIPSEYVTDSELEGKAYATRAEVDKKMEELNIDQLAMYGVEFDLGSSSSPDGTRIGNMTLHKTLPIQSMMRGCLLDDGGNVTKYLDANDWTGETRDGSQGQVMVEVPDHWWKFDFEGKKLIPKLYIVPIPGAVEVKKYYVAAYEATVQRSTNKLCSVVNADADYRGGNNNDEYDGTYRSYLGLPATEINRTNFRAYARNRKEGTTKWNMYTYDVHKDLYWLFVIEYATLNGQKAFNASLTADGYHQGGLGDGFTTLDYNKWSSYNSLHPIVPCGYTDSLGNGTGQVEFTMPTEYDSNVKNLYANRYRGIENPFGHIWQWTDGINVQIEPGDDGLSKVFVCHDPSKFNDTNYDGYSHVGNEARKEGYVKEVIFGEGGEIMPKVVGGGSTTYFCDYHYTNIPTAETLRGVLFGGRADVGASAGFACAYSNSAPSYSSTSVGSRLCFIPNNA